MITDAEREIVKAYADKFCGMAGVEPVSLNDLRAYIEVACIAGWNLRDSKDWENPVKPRPDWMVRHV